MDTHISVGSHACLVSYGDTHETDIPLVLVVGREPNGSSPVTADWGPYDFRKSPNCAFWNIAYGVLGSAATPALTASGVKKMAIAKAASPIIIADAMPQSIDNAVRNKAIQREAISDEAIERHVANVFAHRHLIERVRVVLLSGLDARFVRSARMFEDQCRALKLPVQRLPFFYGTNAPKIRATITAETRHHLEDVANAFVAFKATQVAA